MKRVAVTLTGLFLLTATVTFWVRSFRQVDGLQLFDRAGNLHGIASDRGTILLFTSKIPFGHDKAWSAEPFSVALTDFKAFDSFLYDVTSLKIKFAGFKICANQYTLAATIQGTAAATWPFEAFTIPDWFLTAIISIPTLRSLRGVYLRRRRKARGLCIACGYDLRGSPGRCPECGKV